jgi:uncharacterized protein
MKFRQETIMKIGMQDHFRRLWAIVLFVLLSCALAATHSLAASPGTTAVAPKSHATTAAQHKPAALPAKTETGATKATKPRRMKGDRELLWKMTSESGATLYLLGTVHVFKPEDYPLPAEMEKVFEKARALIVEVDVTKTDPRFSQAFVAQRGLYPASDNLMEHVSTSSRILLQDYCTRRNIQLARLVRMKPWLVALTVLQMELARLGYVPSAGIDVHFLNEANTKGKKIISLETMEFQLNLFASLPDDLQEMDLNLSLVDLGKLPTDAGEMMRAWMDGDDKAMDEVMTKDIKEHPELSPVQEKLLYERNITMAEKLEAYLKGGTDTYLVAIGAGHLVGDRSVLALLKKRGYSVKQVLVGDEI